MEQNFIQNLVTNSGPNGTAMGNVWIGLWRTEPPIERCLSDSFPDDCVTRAREGWTWDDGSRVDVFSHWADNQPDGESQCGRMVVNGNWRDISCDVLQRFICEKSLVDEITTPNTNVNTISSTHAETEIKTSTLKTSTTVALMTNHSTKAGPEKETSTFKIPTAMESTNHTVSIPMYIGIFTGLFFLIIIIVAILVAGERNNNSDKKVEEPVTNNTETSVEMDNAYETLRNTDTVLTTTSLNHPPSVQDELSDESENLEDGDIIKRHQRTSYTPAHELALEYSSSSSVTPEPSPTLPGGGALERNGSSEFKPESEVEYMMPVEIEDSGVSTDTSREHLGDEGDDEDEVFHGDVIQKRNGKGLVMRKKKSSYRPTLSQIENQ
ncbi:hypothetical protein CAPTEDRAFT_227961 [Capitella teleta]|uniref:C-type lectin domain-containing protein n=1 Tax=Capitella teleta TaxID=283909 RepID=R7TRJ7_CAPTE|nr:hypothetical protein CAPTEDRAFT_227961 [Capitella teleta]|eukprot:ELT94121.1 hypothetical protein CAPTEDRAFT_227961 [Capitella teleta]